MGTGRAPQRETDPLHEHARKVERRGANMGVECFLEAKMGARRAMGEFGT